MAHPYAHAPLTRRYRRYGLDEDVSAETSAYPDCASASAHSRPVLAGEVAAEPGLRKRAAWEEVWALQRREDAGESLDIPVPPQYRPTDFRTTAYWRNRGKLDVPKERFMLYPGAGRERDKARCSAGPAGPREPGPGAGPAGDRPAEHRRLGHHVH